MRQPAILIDIDGTLANIDERRTEFLKNKNWDSFYSKISEDHLNVWCRQIIEKFRNDHKIILLTGRRESYEKETLAWLDKNNVFFDKLLFRGKDDFRPDEIVKQEIYENHIRGFFEVLFVVDDRSSVVKMWRSIGLLCLQCDDGNF
ncbi:MAG: polynucleotide kinase [Bdellovibrio sp.]|nr:polynucleotide kinase [Bdellovibrio sp.]